MITRKSYKFLGLHYKIAYAIGAMPFRWDPVTESLSCEMSKLMAGQWYFNMVISLVIEARLMYTIYSAIVNGDRPIGQLVTDIMYSVPYTALIVWHLTTIFMKEQMADLVNQMLNLDKIYTNKYCKNFEEQSDNVYTDLDDSLHKAKSKEVKEETDGCDGNIFASTFMMFVYAALSISLFLKDPMDARYLFADLLRWFGSPGEGNMKMMIYNWAYMEYMQLVRFCLVFNNIFYIHMLYAHSTTYWLQELSRPKNDEEAKTRKIISPVQAEDIFLIYKAEQVLNKHFNECCRSMIFPTFKMLNICLHIIATYVTIMFHGRIPLGGYLIFPIGFFMWCAIENDVYPLLGKIYTLSGSFLDSWKPVLGRQADKDYTAATPIAVQVSNFYLIKEQTVLTIWSFILGQVINCIVMTP